MSYEMARPPGPPPKSKSRPSTRAGTLVKPSGASLLVRRDPVTGQLGTYDELSGFFTPFAKVVSAIAKPAISFVPGGSMALSFASGASTIFGGMKVSGKDAERVQKVQAALTKALAGDAASLSWLRANIGPGSVQPKATRDATRLALNHYDLVRPAPAVAAAVDAGVTAFRPQPQADGTTVVVGTDAAGAVVTQPIPASVLIATQVPIQNVLLPADAPKAVLPSVQQQPAPAESEGIFSIFSKLLDRQPAPAPVPAPVYYESQPAPLPVSAPAVSEPVLVPQAQMEMGGGGVSPLLIAGGAALAFLAFRK